MCYKNLPARLGIAILFVGISCMLYGQLPPDTLIGWPANAANRWMKESRSWSARADTISPALRAQRDRYMDELVGLTAPLTPDNAETKAISEGSTYGIQLAEIPTVEQRSVVIGTFTSYQPVLSASGRSIYTEITFYLTHVFEDSSNQLATGSRMTVIVPGGTVRDASGRTMSFLTHPRQYFVAPGKSYLLAVSFRTAGEFFILGKNWEIAGGVVKPNFVSRRPSAFAGLTLKQLIDAIPVDLTKTR
jgi:hypothetical protein